MTSNELVNKRYRLWIYTFKHQGFWSATLRDISLLPCSIFAIHDFFFGPLSYSNFAIQKFSVRYATLNSQAKNSLYQLQEHMRI